MESTVDPGSVTDEGEAVIAARLKALGHPVRIGIIRQLQQSECCCGDLCACLPLAQSTVSQHLDLLRRTGLVELRTEGNRSRYRLNREALQALARELENVALEPCEGRSCAN
jgi:ArsR family transcriptional regulator